MTAPHPLRGQRRLTGPALAMLLALAVLLMPVGYLFVSVWSANTSAAGAVETERAAVAFGRPLNTLMAMLVDARTTAVQKITIEDSEITAAVKQVNLIDRDAAELLGTDQRWAELDAEITSTLNNAASGSDALAAYATPIRLAQAMLDWIAQSALAQPDPGGSTQLLEVALHQLPQSIAAAGELAAAATSGEDRAATQLQLAISQDRVVRLAEQVSTTLRTASDRSSAPFAAGLDILTPLDTFAAAANELTSGAAELSRAGLTAIELVQLRERIDTASTRVRTAALQLSSALFDAFDAQLSAAASGYERQRWLLTVSVLVVVLAVAALMWLRFPWPQRRRSPQAEPDKTGRHGVHEGIEVRPSDPLVDARELLARESDRLSRAVGLRKR